MATHFTHTHHTHTDTHTHTHTHQYASSQTDSKGRWEGGGKQCGKKGMMCILEGNAVCGALEQIVLFSPRSSSDLPLERLSFQAGCSWPNLWWIIVL